MNNSPSLSSGLKFLGLSLPIIVFVTLLGFSFKTHHFMRAMYAHSSFYIIFMLFVLWAAHAFVYLKHRRFALIPFIHSNWIGITVSLALTAVIFASVPVYLKILNDETNLLAVSQSMFYHQDAYRISMGKYFSDTFHVVRNHIPNRPLMFPFATYLIHAFLGYNYQNVFILNFLTAFLFLTGVFVCTKHFTDAFAACAAVFFVAAYPVFTIYGTSGGYDLFSTFFFYLTMVILYQHLGDPGPRSFALLWTTLLMFINIRYESIIFFLIIVMGTFLATRRFYFKKLAYLYLSTPLLLLPYLWQRTLSVGTYENPENVSLFSLSAFIEHLRLMISGFFNFNFVLPYNGILNAIAIAGILLVLSQLMLKKIPLKPFQVYFWSIYIASIGVSVVIVLSHFMGVYGHPAQSRLFFYFCIFCALSPVGLKIAYSNIIDSKMMLIFALLLFALYHPIAEKQELINKLLISRSHKQETKFLNSLKKKDILILSAYPGQFTAKNYGALSIKHANAHIKQVKKEIADQLYSEVLVFQHINSTTNAPAFENQMLSPALKTEPIRKISVFPNIFLQISRII